MLADYLSLFLLVLTMPGTLYIAALTLSAALYRPRRLSRPGRRDAHPLRVAIVVPAHDEESSIDRTIVSLKAQIRLFPGTRLVVVADNCTDRTAMLSRSMGAEVIERHDPVNRGKGYALAHAFERIQDVDWFIVVDADTDVAPGFLEAMRSAMREGASALQCRYLVRDPLTSRRHMLSEVALSAWNVLRPRGRAGLGLSAGILGNGFALSRSTLDRVPYTAHSIVEDAEYHLLLLGAGMKVQWADAALVRGDMPCDAAAFETQRIRWEGGRLRLACDRMPGLVGGLLKGRVLLLDPLLDLMLMPLAQHVSLLLLALLLALFLGDVTQVTLAMLSLVLIAGHVLVGLRLTRAPLACWKALLGIPLYIVRKNALIGRILRSASRNAPWVRTARGSSQG